MAVQAIPYRPGQDSSKGESIVIELRKFLPRERIKAILRYVQFLLKRYVMNDDIAKPDPKVRSLHQGSMTPTEFLQDLWTKTLSCGSVSDEKSFMALFVDIVNHSIRKTLRHWWAEHQYASLEELVQRAEYILDSLGRPPQKEAINAGQLKYRNEHRDIRTRKEQLTSMERDSPRIKGVVNGVLHREVTHQERRECRQAKLLLHLSVEI